MHFQTLPGWEPSDIRPLSRTSLRTRSLDTGKGADGSAIDVAAPAAPDHDYLDQLRRVHESIGELHDLPARCECGRKFTGSSCEFRASIILSKGDGSDPIVSATLCQECFVANMQCPQDSRQREAQLRFRKGETQTSIASALGVNQSTVSRWLREVPGKRNA